MLFRSPLPSYIRPLTPQHPRPPPRPPPPRPSTPPTPAPTGRLQFGSAGGTVPQEVLKRGLKLGLDGDLVPASRWAGTREQRFSAEASQPTVARAQDSGTGFTKPSDPSGGSWAGRWEPQHRVPEARSPLRLPPATLGPARRPTPRTAPGSGRGLQRGSLHIPPVRGSVLPPLLCQAGTGASQPPGHAVPWPGLLAWSPCWE